MGLAESSNLIVSDIRREAMPILYIIKSRFGIMPVIVFRNRASINYLMLSRNGPDTKKKALLCPRAVFTSLNIIQCEGGSCEQNTFHGTGRSMEKFDFRT